MWPLISVVQMLQVDVSAVVSMNELKNLTNVVIGKLGQLVHKQNSRLFFMNYNIIIEQVIYITIDTKEAAPIGENGLLFPHS